MDSIQFLMVVLVATPFATLVVIGLAIFLIRRI